MSKKDFESFVQTASLAADVAAIPSNPVASQLEPSTPLPAIPPAGSEDYGDAAGILGGDTANDVNLQLMAKDWGVNPPQREVNSAKKPRSKPDTTQTLGLGRARLPRERGGTGVAEHLPPPLLPATAGWGLGSTFGGIPEEPGGGLLHSRAMRARPFGRQTPSCGSKCSVGERAGGAGGWRRGGTHTGKLRSAICCRAWLMCVGAHTSVRSVTGVEIISTRFKRSKGSED